MSDLDRYRNMRLESNIRKRDLIIVDELGYLPMDTRGAEHLFGFFSQCYEQVSLIVTTNLPFAEWPGDARLAGAVIDRLTPGPHRGDCQRKLPAQAEP